METPQRLSNFRPNSLVKSLYKVLSNVLSNRVCDIIGNVISESQSTFVHGRHILDGILIENELVDDL